LNIKSNFFKDLLNDEPFAKKDIITIQDPSNLSKFNMNNFFYLKEKLKWTDDDTIEKQDPKYFLTM
jgi:peptidyl-prolyl cis-trans isomerase-like protein 2